MWPMTLTHLVSIARTLKVLDMTFSSRLFALVAWCFIWVVASIARFPRFFLRASSIRRLLNSRYLPRLLHWFFRCIRCRTPTTPSLRHQLFCLLSCDLRALLLFTAVTTLSAAVSSHCCRGKQPHIEMDHHPPVLLASMSSRSKQRIVRY